MYRRARLPLPLVAGAVGIGIMSGSFIFRPALEDYWSQHPAREDVAASSCTAPDQSSQPPSSTEAAATATASARNRKDVQDECPMSANNLAHRLTSCDSAESLPNHCTLAWEALLPIFDGRVSVDRCGTWMLQRLQGVGRDRLLDEHQKLERNGGMDKMSSRPEWEMLPGFPSCMCSTNAEQLPSELGPGVPAACSHLYVKKPAAMRDVFHIAISAATSVGDSPVGDSDKPQGVRLLRGGPMTIVIHPTSPGVTQERPRPGQSRPTFSSLADERAADDSGVLLMGGVSRANSLANSKKQVEENDRHSSKIFPNTAKKRALPFRRSRTSSADGRCRKSNAMHSVTLKMPSRAFEVDVLLEKVLKDTTANSPDQLAGRTCMVGSSDTNGQKEKSIRCYKHTISSLISSRIGDMNRESRMLQKSECKRRGAHRPRRPPSLPRQTSAPDGSNRSCLYDSFSKHMKRQPRQFSFH